MPSARGLRAWLMAGVVAISVGCGTPPEREMQQAQGAIDAARAAGADDYAREELEAARVALGQSQAAVEAGDYRLALSHAVDSRDRAQQAARMAADGKAVARVEADRAVTALASVLTTGQTAVAAAEAARVQARIVTAFRDAHAHAERQLQEARTAFEAGAYGEVVTLAGAAMPAVSAALSELQAATTAAPRRSR